MLTELFFILTVSLFDSFSTTQQIVIFVLILTTTRPVKNSLYYLAGLIAAYFACGMAGYLALDSLNAFVSNYVSFKGRMSDQAYYQTQLLMGIVFTAIGVLYFRYKKRSTGPELENVLMARFNSMNGWIACMIGVVISVTGFPLSLPYIAVLGKFALMKMSLPDVVKGVVLYNVFYALPMIVILVIYVSTGAAGKEGIENRLNERARKLNINLTSAMFVLLGLISIADALIYFTSGQPIFKNRYF